MAWLQRMKGMSHNNIHFHANVVFSLVADSSVPIWLDNQVRDQSATNLSD